MINLATLAASIYLACRFGDRLRIVNWKNVRPLYVGLYLCGMLWALGVMYATVGDCADGVVHWINIYFRSTGMGALFCLLEITKHNWADGVPEAAKTVPAELHDGVHQ